MCELDKLAIQNLFSLKAVFRRSLKKKRTPNLYVFFSYILLSKWWYTIKRGKLSIQIRITIDTL